MNATARTEIIMGKKTIHSSGRLFVISGPAGVGKDTLMARVLPEFPNLVKTITTTTRPRKEGEVQGRDYFFVTVEEFQRMIDTGQLLEWAKVHERYYGSPKQWVQEQLAQGRSVALVIDVQGGLNVKTMFPDAVLIFVRPPHGREREILIERIAGRGRDSAEEVQVRLKTAEWELSQADKYDYQIVNEDLEEATRQLKDIIQREVPNDQSLQVG
jgi:guanylate kinase